MEEVGVLEVIFSVPLQEVKSYSLGGKYITANGAHFHESWLVSWNLAERKVVLGEGWEFKKERDSDILWFKNVKIFGNDGGSFMSPSLVELVRDCRNNKVLYSKTAS